MSLASSFHDNVHLDRQCWHSVTDVAGMQRYLSSFCAFYTLAYDLWDIFVSTSHTEDVLSALHETFFVLTGFIDRCICCFCENGLFFIDSLDEPVSKITADMTWTSCRWQHCQSRSERSSSALVNALLPFHSFSSILSLPALSVVSGSFCSVNALPCPPWPWPLSLPLCVLVYFEQLSYFSSCCGAGVTKLKCFPLTFCCLSITAT